MKKYKYIGKCTAEDIFNAASKMYGVRSLDNFCDYGVTPAMAAIVSKEGFEADISVNYKTKTVYIYEENIGGRIYSFEILKNIVPLNIFQKMEI